MSDELTIITNNVPRNIVDEYELTAKEREQFDYLDWAAMERGEDSASFFRYKGQLYDLGDIESVSFTGFGSLPQDHPFVTGGWHGFVSDSFFSGIVMKWCKDMDQVIVGRYFS